MATERELTEADHIMGSHPARSGGPEPGCGLCRQPACKNYIGGWYRRRACQRHATGDDGLCNICRGYLKRSMNAIRRERAYHDALVTQHAKG